MKTKEKNTEKLAQTSKADLLTLVSAKIKGKILFPEKVERDRELVKNVKSWPENLKIS